MLALDVRILVKWLCQDYQTRRAASLLDRVAKDVGALSISVRAGVDWRSADVSTTVSELSLPCSDSAQLTVTACGADGHEVARAVFPVVENGVFSLSAEGLTAGALYTFWATLAVEDAAAAGGDAFASRPIPSWAARCSAQWPASAERR